MKNAASMKTAASKRGASDGTDLQGMDTKTLTMRAPSTAERDAFLNAHNKYRCMHGVDAVEWSEDVAADANTYISPMTSMAHSASYNLAPPAGPAGENLYWSSGAASAERAVDSWYSEVDDCLGGPTGFTDGCATGANGRATGHYTAMVWKGVKSIGCAFSNSGGLIICRYKAGDYLSNDTPNMNRGTGNYVNHVFPRTKSEAECGSGSSTPPTTDGGVATAPSPTPAASVDAPGGIDYEHCVAAGSRGQCETCTHSSQCAGDSFCCPFMKKCVPSSSTSCFTPVAYCMPPCHEKDSGATCKCRDSAFPTTWLGKECSAPTPAPTEAVSNSNQEAGAEGTGQTGTDGTGQKASKSDGNRRAGWTISGSCVCALWLFLL